MDVGAGQSGRILSQIVPRIAGEHFDRRPEVQQIPTKRVVCSNRNSNKSGPVQSILLGRIKVQNTTNMVDQVGSLKKFAKYL